MTREGPARIARRGIAVLGLGNVLMGDDAFGPTLIRFLEARYEFPGDVELIDAGTPGHDLSLYMEGWRALIVVDAVKMSGAAGEVRSFRGEEILMRSSSPVVSPHEPGLAEAFLKLRFAGGLPGEVLVVGVNPMNIGTHLGLSTPVKNAIPVAEEMVLQALGLFGVSARERIPPHRPDIWWDS